MQDFFEFIYDRQYVWHRRFVQKVPPPWTDHPAFSRYRFTNMYRELDRVSLYVIRKVCAPPMSDEKRVINLLAARVFNQDYTFTTIMPLINPDIFDWKATEALLDRKKSEGVKLWRSAYTLNQTPFPANLIGQELLYRKSDKHVQFIMLFEHLRRMLPAYTARLKGSRSLEMATNIIAELPLVGEFLGAEIAQDLAYSGFFVNGMTDDNDLAVVGPGAVGGIEALFGKQSKKQLRDRVEELRDRQRDGFNQLYVDTGKQWDDIRYKQAFTQPWLSINNMESALCEYRKWQSWKTGKGRPRYYKGAS